MATSYEIFLKGDDGFTRVSTIEANNPKQAHAKLTDAAKETGTDASGDYMVVPTGNVSYFRGKLRAEPTYDVVELELYPEPTSLAAVPDAAEEDAS